MPKTIKPLFKLDVDRDVDLDDDGPILNLPRGWCFDDPGNTPHDTLHTRGYSNMRELRKAIKTEVIPCTCNGCTN
jgi:hypothetical protein